MYGSSEHFICSWCKQIFSPGLLQNLRDPVQNEKAEPLIQRLSRISTAESETKHGPLGVPGPALCTGRPPRKPDTLLFPIALKRNKEPRAIPLLALPLLPQSHKKRGREKKSLKENKEGTQKKTSMSSPSTRTNHSKTSAVLAFN